MAQVAVRNLTKSYSKHITPVRSVSFEVADKEFLTVLGPSGCGKSTILRLIAGLEAASAGEIFIDERLVNDLSPSERDIAMVFQNYALYPHMTVYDNIAVNLKLKKIPGSEIATRVSNTARLLEIDALLQRKPRELSGGQRQRVALGRAIVRNPKVFLLDEPLSNLDAILRERMRAELKSLFTSLSATVIYVTHDQTEAMTLSSRIAVVSEGTIRQLGTPHEVYHEPASIFVATFLGSPRINVFKCPVVPGGVMFGQKAIALNHDQAQKLVGREEVLVGIRPEDVRVGKGPLRGRLELVEPLGAFTLIRLRAEGLMIQALVEPENCGESELAFDIDPAAIHLFDPDTEARV